jgi:FolB domain-containing protein
MKTTILVNGFELSCLIGILDHEHLTPQRIRVSLEITLKTKDPIKTIDDSLCYMAIQDVVRGATKTHIPLVEDLASTVVRHYMSDPRVEAVTIEILKLDVAPNAQGVGVRVSDGPL